jgi:N-acetyl sugar amidotransferase
MDTTDPAIRFDREGICHYCRKYEPILDSQRVPEERERERLETFAREIRDKQSKGPYDSILGLSGGIDSSYAAYLAKRIGLKPLAVHFDNGWNSELAVENIRHIVEKLDLDLYTYVVDWEEFKDLQRAFFIASVIDIEIVTDHAILAVLARTAREHGIKYILSGTNLATENGLPKAWCWHKQDLMHIRAVQRQFGSIPIKTFPTLSTRQWHLDRFLGLCAYRIPLNLIHYQKNKAAALLSKELGWRPYAGKHHESIFTKFYQGYVLPEKFGIDKRKAHLSGLIRNGEMTRQEALVELSIPPYDPEQLHQDRIYVLKKLGFTEDEFNRIMKLTIRSHLDYPSDWKWYRPFFPLLQGLRRLGLAREADI